MGPRMTHFAGELQMLNTRRLITSIAIIMICFMAFLTGYSKSANFVFAINDDTLWQPLESENDLVDAFQKYCKSRDVTIEGSVADAVTTATTGSFNGICNRLGIDMTALQADIKKSTDQYGNIQYLFNSNGITAYNRIFAQFLQDNELEVGDEDVEKTIYSGMVYTDNDGVNSLVTFFDPNDSDNVTALGTAYHGYDGWYAVNDVVYPSNTQYPTVTLNGFNFNYVDNSSHIFQIQKRAVSEEVYRYRGSIDHLSASNFWMYNSGNTGMFSVLYNIRTNEYYIGSVDFTTNKVGGTKLQITPNNGQSQQTNIIIVAPTINNNNYEGDTIINNYGVPSDPNEPDEPDNPSTPTPPPYDPPEADPPDWDIDMPDLDINWILTGKEQKFPWDIPFNVMFALSLLNADPKTPELEGTLDLGVYQWNYKLDLHQFDSVAETCRNFEFLAFLIGLMLMTKKLIWG